MLMQINVLSKHGKAVDRILTFRPGGPWLSNFVFIFYRCLRPYRMCETYYRWQKCNGTRVGEMDREATNLRARRLLSSQLVLAQWGVRARATMRPASHYCYVHYMTGLHLWLLCVWLCRCCALLDARICWSRYVVNVSRTLLSVSWHLVSVDEQ